MENSFFFEKNETSIRNGETKENNLMAKGQGFPSLTATNYKTSSNPS